MSRPRKVCVVGGGLRYEITEDMLWSVEGLTTPQVAERWGCSQRTVFRHAVRMGFRRRNGPHAARYLTAPCSDCKEVVRREALSHDRRCESCRYGNSQDWLALEREASRRRLQAKVAP